MHEDLDVVCYKVYKMYLTFIYGNVISVIREWSLAFSILYIDVFTTVGEKELLGK